MGELLGGVGCLLGVEGQIVATLHPAHHAGKHSGLLCNGAPAEAGRADLQILIDGTNRPHQRAVLQPEQDPVDADIVGVHVMHDIPMAGMHPPMVFQMEFVFCYILHRIQQPQLMPGGHVGDVGIQRIPVNGLDERAEIMIGPLVVSDLVRKVHQILPGAVVGPDGSAVTTITVIFQKNPVIRFILKHNLILSSLICCHCEEGEARRGNLLRFQHPLGDCHTSLWAGSQ